MIKRENVQINPPACIASTYLSKLVGSPGTISYLAPSPDRNYPEKERYSAACSANEIESIIGLRFRQTDLNPKVNGYYRKRSVDPRVGISRSASETDVWLFFLSMTLKIIKYYSSFYYIWPFSSQNDIVRASFGVYRGDAKVMSRRKTTLSERHSVFIVVMQKWCHLWNFECWRHF